MRTSSGARQYVKYAPLAALLIVLLPALAAAQKPVTSFDQLNTRLKPGDTVWLTDAEGRETKGKIRDLSPASLRLSAGGTTQDVEAARVGAIRVQPKDSLKNGVLWGVLIGFVGGALSCGLNPECAGDEAGAGIAAGLGIIGAAAGAGIGAWIDSAIKGPKLVVYRAPGASDGTRLSLAPVITPRTKGVAVTYSF